MTIKVICIPFFKLIMTTKSMKSSVCHFDILYGNSKVGMEKEEEGRQSSDLSAINCSVLLGFKPF